ncbi:cutinase-domain-containing protein [Trichodelitschia bisporula]|uniref:cutinase n=1 Tax=Trichodelitschia bisporula TaxID=703511 RepID=A0A6G1HPP8_9PEZI|nr:cutinase-domain-containing protein [Trichodelitschia bisporula]
MHALLPLLLPLLALPSALGQKCTGQSCEIANLSGSTGLPFKLDPTRPKPSGSNEGGFKCIQSHRQYGAGVASAADIGVAPKTSPSRERYLWPERLGYDRFPEVLPDRSGPERFGLTPRQAGGCKPYTLVFARGTTEPGTMGMTVGPTLSSGLKSAMPGKWDVQGVSYTADIAGDNCIGLPGGVKCMAQINKIAAKCPSTKMVVSGYSQGAMVARICVAFAEEKARRQVAGIVVFGDPFNGAPVKDFPSENVKTFCAAGDGVCQGKFIISGAHLSYTGASTSQAVKWIQQRVTGA